MHSNNKITVAIPIYNGQKYILEALQSIVDQTQKVDQIIVCDNQSTDDTVNLVKQFFSEHNNIVCRLQQNQSNLGYQKNFNKCMEFCKTEYLLLLAADDRLKNNTIEVTSAFLNKHKDFAFAGGYADSIDETGAIILKHQNKSNQFFNKGEILEFLQSNRLYIIPSSILMRMKYIRKIGYWDLYPGPDERFWPKVIKQYPIAILNDCLVDRRQHKEQVAIHDYGARYNDVIKSLRENLTVASLERSDERIKKARKLLEKQNSSSSIMMGGLVLKHHRQFRIALQYWRFGIQQYPAVLYKTNFLIKLTRLLLYQMLVSLRLISK